MSELRYDVKVVYWVYDGPGAERLAGRDFAQANKAVKKSSASVFRTKSLADHRVWHLIIAGEDEQIEAVRRRVRYGREVPEPEDGLSDAIRARRARHVLESAATGEPFGKRSFLVGAELDRAGRLHPRRPQG